MLLLSWSYLWKFWWCSLDLMATLNLLGHGHSHSQVLGMFPPFWSDYRKAVFQDIVQCSSYPWQTTYYKSIGIVKAPFKTNVLELNQVVWPRPGLIAKKYITYLRELVVMGESKETDIGERENDTLIHSI